MNNTPNLPDILAQVPLFAGIAPADAAAVAEVALERPLSRGESVFVEGNDSDALWIVIAGRVKVFKVSPDGKEQILHLFGPGEPFGEAAMFAGKPFPAHAQAVETSHVMAISKEALLALFERRPALAMNMLGVLSQRLHRFAALVESLSLKEAPGRLAAWLCYASQRQGGTDAVTLDMSKAQLAAVLGTVPETLSRILARMAAEGLIDPDTKPRIRILDHQGLQDLAEGTRRLA